MAARSRSIDIRDSTSGYHAAAVQSVEGTQLHISGQPGSIDGYVPGDYESQIQLALLNISRVLAAVGASVSDIVKLNVYIVGYDPKQRKHVKHLRKYLGVHRPAITLVPVQQLALPSWLFEIDAIVAPCVPRPAVEISELSINAAKDVDVVIIGAGLAGLAAARKVSAAGLSYVVLEARNRVGGRTWSMPITNEAGILDMGAAWINDTNQSRMISLAREFGAELIEQNTSGKCVLEEQAGSVSTFMYGDLPQVGSHMRIHLAEIRDMVESECQKVDCWDPRSIDLDCQTFEAFLKEKGAKDMALATATVWTRAMLGQEPSQVSALYFLNYCKSGGGLLQMRSDRRGGGQHLRVRQGTQLFSRGLASSLDQGSVILSSPVHSVCQLSQQKVFVRSTSASFNAKKVISAVPVTTLRNIEFVPSLPPQKKLLTDSFRYGYYTKSMMIFDSPFWVQNGYCGLTQSLKGPASVIRDTSIPADGKWVLTCFMAGDPGYEWSLLSPKAREEALIKQISTLFQIAELELRKMFSQMLCHEWSTEQWSGFGCPCPALAPGVLHTVGNALRAPFLDVHFAGTETAAEWKGYMEGAVRSGERAGEEILADLTKVQAML